MKEFILFFLPPQDVSTHYRSVDMTAFAAFATGFCLRHCVFLCKGTKAQEFAGLLLLPPLRLGFAKKNSVSLCKGTKLKSLPVLALGCFLLGQNLFFFFFKHFLFARKLNVVLKLKKL